MRQYIRKYGNTIVNIIHYPRITFVSEKNTIQFFEAYAAQPFEVPFRTYDQAKTEFEAITTLDPKYQHNSHRSQQYIHTVVPGVVLTYSK